MNMPGIEFLIDGKGQQRAVLIDLKKHAVLWENLFDAYIAHQRRKEPRDPLTRVKALVELKAMGQSRRT